MRREGNAKEGVRVRVPGAGGGGGATRQRGSVRPAPRFSVRVHNPLAGCQKPMLDTKETLCYTSGQ